MGASISAEVPPRRYRYLDLVMTFLVVVLVVNNVASSAKIVDMGISLFGFPLAFDGGALLFPMCSEMFLPRSTVSGPPAG